MAETNNLDGYLEWLLYTSSLLVVSVMVPSMAQIIFGGSNTTNTELWNGTSFTEVNDLNTSGGYISSFGTSTSAIAGNRYQPGQSPAYTQNVVESWDGTSWTEINDIATAKFAKFAASNTGGAARAIASGGGDPASNVTEEFTADNVLSTITVS